MGGNKVFLQKGIFYPSYIPSLPLYAMITNHIIESFLKCPYKAYLHVHNEQGNQTDYGRLETELVSMYRTKFYEQLHSKYDEPQVLRGVTFEKKVATTGMTYVLEPVFQSEEVQIRFDALEITPHKEFPSKLVYLQIEVIPNEKVSKTDKLALAVKCLLLTQTQRRVTPEFGKIVYGRALNSTKVKLAVYAKEARKVIKDLTKTLQSNDLPRFFQINECRTCQFQEDCQAKLVEKDDLGLLAGMNSKNVLKQNNRGIFTVLQFSYTFRPRRRNKKAANKPLRFEPALKALALRGKKTYIQELPKLPETDVEVYLDFEGLPDENVIYLIGLIIKHGVTEQQFSFWADTKEDEEAIFAQLFETLAPFDNFTLYHYGSYEVQALKRLNRRFDNRYEDEVNWMLEKSVNILSFFSSTIYPPTYTNELKDIARFLGFRWSEEDASGIQSIVWRKRWELSQEVEYKNKLIQYNLEDCEALKLTKDWMTGISKKIEQENNEDIVQTTDVKDVKSKFYNWGKFRSQLDDFERINKCAYFNYQREKVYLRTNTCVKKALKRKTKKLKSANKVNKIVQIIPDQCPFCLSREISCKYKLERIFIDLKFIGSGVKKWVLKFKSGLFKCTNCKETFIPKRYKMHSDYRYKHNLIAWIINQHFTYRISLGNITAILLETFDIQINISTISAYKERFVEEYKMTYALLKQETIHGNLLQVDETPIPLNKTSSGYVWVFASIDAVFYLFRPNREADFLKDLLKEFNGVLVSDFYSGYDSLPCFQQKCLIHLMRDLNSDFYKNQLNDEFKAIVIAFGKLLRAIVETIDKYGLKKHHLNKHVKDVEKFYKQVIDKEYETDIAISWQKRFIKNKDKLFTFLNYDSVPWNNNNAEAAIKVFAEFRRIGKYTFTNKALNEYLVLLSIQQTCKYRGLSFLEFLKSGEKSIEAYTRKVLG